MDLILLLQVVELFSSRGEDEYHMKIGKVYIFKGLASFNIFKLDYFLIHESKDLAEHFTV